MTGQDNFLIILDRELRIEYCNRAFADAVGFKRSGDAKLPIGIFVAQRDRKKLETWLRKSKTGDALREMTFKFLSRNRTYIPVKASCLADAYPERESCAISAQPETSEDLDVGTMREDIEFLRKVIDQSTEAMWCIEFWEPVDLLEDEDEVVRQVFENHCSLRLCNKAMMRLYDIPDDTDIKELPVSRNFPRSRANERYIRGLVRERFHVDTALSIDIKYGGQAIYGDNSVRSEIVHNKLLRFWGTMRDVTAYRQLQAQMNREQRSLQSILASIPEAVLVVGKDLRLKGANPAYETLLDQSIDFALDKKVDTLFDFGLGLSELECLEAGSLIRCEIRSLQKDMVRREFVAWVAPMSDIGATSGLIITLRPVEPPVRDKSIARKADCTL